MNRERTVRRLAWAIALVPPVFLIGMYLCFSTDVPFMDQWEFPAFFERWQAGTLTGADWLAQHNEHRILFPRLIMVALAQITNWDIRAELIVNLLLGLGITALVLAQSYFAAHRDGHRLPAWWPFAVTLLCCSLVQWQNWFLGWQLQLFLAVLCIHLVIGLLLFTGRIATHAAALLLAIVASLSFASGLLVWPLAALACALNSHATTRRRTLETPAWILAGLLCGACYFHNYTTPGYHPPLSAVLSKPLQDGVYLLVYLGQPIAGFSLWGSGAVGGMALLAALRGAVRTPKPAGFLPRLALIWAVWALGNAAITVIARADLGAVQALSARYATLALPIWPAILLAFAIPQNRSRAGAVLLPMAVLGTAAIASLIGAYRWTEHYHVYESTRPALIAGAPVEPLHWLYPDTEALLEKRAIAARHHWTVFAQ